ncbi:MAD2L1-binding protein [Lampris incognitus]|uniref:MAD2L1-binding protein n=1 Tax=Lampris incognitus TaxID=2546036 RepID=UPI0024B5C840|nr:MAD2L1-binding protein [Lampris incognitus]
MAEADFNRSSAVSENTTRTDRVDPRGRMPIASSPENDVVSRNEADTRCERLSFRHTRSNSDAGTHSHRSPTGSAEQLSTPETSLSLNAPNTPDEEAGLSEHLPKSRQCNTGSSEDKENAAVSPTPPAADNAAEEDGDCPEDLQMPSLTAAKRGRAEVSDEEVIRSAREEGRVDVVFPGAVTQDGCCRFVSEILKCVLYQRQQLPMTYDQLVHFQKKQQASLQDKEVVSWRPVQSVDMNWRKCQQTLHELEEVLQQLQVLFSLSLVPRVLLLLGGSLILPKELYEINMEALVLAAGDQSLQVSSCLRQLFRTLFVADLLSDARPVRLMATTVLVLAHRDCGVGWFRPKLDFKVPTRVKNQIIALSTTAGVSRVPLEVAASEWQDYIWYRAPLTIKGFSK